MEYWNVPGYAPPVPQAPATPVQGTTQFVGADDYLKKKRIAAQLRAGADKGMGRFDPLVQTQGTGNMPGYTQVNYAGILGNALAPWLESKQAEKAGAAEDEASAAKMAALDQMLGNKNLTAADAIRAKEQYGIDVSGAVVDKDAARNKAMAMVAQSPSMAAGYLADGTLDQVTVDAIEASRKAMSAEEWERKKEELRFEAGLKPGPVAKQRDPMKDLQAQYVTQLGQGDGEGAQKTLSQIQALTVAGAVPKTGTTGSGTGRGKAQDPAQEAASLSDVAGQLQAILDDPESEKDLFSTSQSILIPAAMNVAGSDAGQGSFITQAAGKYAQGKESPAAAMVRRLGTDASFAKVKELYPASNSDINLARSLQVQAGQSREAMQRYVDHMLYMADKYPVDGVAGSGAAPTDSGTQEITSQAAYDALPSGATYMEGGRMYRKP